MTEIKHVLCTKELVCTHCKDGRIPGGPYKDEGEVVTCPFCRGKTEEQVSIPFETFCDFVRDRMEATT